MILAPKLFGAQVYGIPGREISLVARKGSDKRVKATLMQTLRIGSRII